MAFAFGVGALADRPINSVIFDVSPEEFLENNLFVHFFLFELQHVSMLVKLEVFNE